MDKITPIDLATSHHKYYNYLIENGVSEQVALKMTENYQNHLLMIYMAQADLKLPTGSDL